MSGQLKEVRDRMKSVKSTQQITKAMKMVSAAKLRKAQQSITEMRPYADRLNKILKNILSYVEGDADTTFGQEREVKRAAIAVITSSKGLCGAFNANILKQAFKAIDEEINLTGGAKHVTAICVGKKGYEAIKRKYPTIHVKHDFVEVYNNQTFENISRVSQYLMDKFLKGKYDRVTVCYSQFVNAAVQEAQAIQFLPVEKMEGTKEPSDDNQGQKTENADYIFEPSKEQLLEELVPSILQTSFQKCVLDTHASEHGARMTAMDNATENAQELLRTLKIQYNKARQEAITREISEIVGGAAALGG